MSHHSAIIRVRNLSFSYQKTDNPVLKNIDFDIHEGDFVGIIGPNGGGKTTLLKLIINILPLQKGSIELFGKDIHTFKNWSCIGYVSQKATQFDSQFPATVSEVVAMGRAAHRGFFRSLGVEDKRMIEQSLHDVDMFKYRDTPIHDLSGGQQQRVFIARALASSPCLLALDEPTTGVDSHAQEEFYLLLQKLRKEKHLTIILVSHDIDVIATQVTMFACLNQTLVYHGKPEKMYGQNLRMIIHGH